MGWFALYRLLDQQYTLILEVSPSSQDLGPSHTVHSTLHRNALHPTERTPICRGYSKQADYMYRPHTSKA